MTVLDFCSGHGKERAREEMERWLRMICGLVFGSVFEVGSYTKRVAWALIPIDVSHLALAKRDEVREMGE